MMQMAKQFSFTAEANICSRLDVTLTRDSDPVEGYNFGFAKVCGGVNAPNDVCCPNTSCDHTETKKNGAGGLKYSKRCVTCARKNKYAAECDPDNYPFPDHLYNDQTNFGDDGVALPKICCTGLECNGNKKCVCKCNLLEMKFILSI